MYQEKREEENLPALKTALTHRCNDYIEKRGEGLITATRNDTDNTKTNRMTTTRKQNGKGKQLYGRFKRLVSNISHEKTWTSLRKGNFKRESESLQLEAENNAGRTNNIEARIDKTQQNTKCRLCNDRDKTVYYIISECGKLAQKEYKTSHEWVGKVIHWKLCKKFKLTIRTNGACTTQHLSWTFNTHKLLGILTYKPIT